MLGSTKATRLIMLEEKQAARIAVNIAKLPESLRRT